VGAEGTEDVVRQHDELSGCAGRGDRAAGRACQFADDRGGYRRELRPVITTGAEVMGPDLPNQATQYKHCRRGRMTKREPVVG